MAYRSRTGYSGGYEKNSFDSGNYSRPSCIPCAVTALPTVNAPGSISADTPFSLTGNLHGGNYNALGDVGCKTVRHEVIVVGTGNGIGTGVTVDSWTDEVLVTKAYSRTPTVTAAQLVTLGSPAAVDIYVRSWTCNDVDSSADFATSGVV